MSSDRGDTEQPKGLKAGRSTDVGAKAPPDKSSYYRSSIRVNEDLGDLRLDEPDVTPRHVILRVSLKEIDVVCGSEDQISFRRCMVPGSTKFLIPQR